MMTMEKPELELKFNSDRNDILKLLERTNPPEANLVLIVDSEIAHSPGLTWKVEHYFYILEIAPSSEGVGAWLLFEISWDDNEGIWHRSVFKELPGVANQEHATALLLNEYWESINVDTDDPVWSPPFAEFRKRALMILES